MPLFLSHYSFKVGVWAAYYTCDVQVLCGLDVGEGVEGEGHVVLNPQVVEDGRVLVLHVLLTHLQPPDKQVNYAQMLFIIKQTEEKAKVVAAVWGKYLNAALAI